MTVTRTANTSAVPTWTRTQLMVTENDTGCSDVIHQLTNTKASANNTRGHVRHRRAVRPLHALRQHKGASVDRYPATVDRTVYVNVDLTTTPPTPNRNQGTLTTPAAGGGTADDVCF